MNRFVVLLAVVLSSSFASASVLHVGASITVSQPTEGPIPVAANYGAAATDGSSTLIATNSYAFRDASVTLVDSAGNVVSSRHLDFGQVNEIPLVRWDGTQYIVFTTGWATSNFRVLRATKVSRDGVIGDTTELRRDIVGVPAVAFDGRNYAVAYGWVNVAYYNEKLEYRGIDMQLVLAGDVQETPAIDAEAGGFLVLYSTRASNGEVELTTARLDDDGRVLARSLIARGSTPASFKYLRVTSNESTAIAGWTSDDDSAWAMLLNSNGSSAGAPVRFFDHGYFTAAAPFGSSYLLAVGDGVNHNLCRVAPDATLGSQVLSAGGVSPGAIVSTGSDAVVLTFASQINGTKYDLANRPVQNFSVSLNPVTTRGASAPMIVWGEHSYLAAWQETHWINGEPVDGIATRLLTRDGTPYGPSSWFVGGVPQQLAFGQGVFVVLGQTPNTVTAHRISDNGDLLDPEPRTLLDWTGTLVGPCGDLRLAFDGASFRLFYTPCKQCKWAFEPGDVMSVTMSAAGVVDAPELLRGSSDFKPLQSVTCLSGGQQCTADWTEINFPCEFNSGPVVGRGMRFEAGQSIDSSPLTLTASGDAPLLAGGDDRYLAIWGLHAGLLDTHGSAIKGPADGTVLQEFATPHTWISGAIWDGSKFLLYAAVAVDEPPVPPIWTSRIIALDDNANRSGDQVVTTPLLAAMASSRDGRSVALALRETAPGVNVVDALPIVETSHGRAIAR